MRILVLLVLLLDTLLVAVSFFLTIGNVSRLLGAGSWSAIGYGLMSAAVPIGIGFILFNKYFTFKGLK